MPKTVKYEVEATTIFGAPIQMRVPADITVETPDGTEQANVSLPLKMKDGSIGYEKAFMPGNFVYISAQKGDYEGSITCRITVSDIDGANSRVISENTSSGDYAVATCRGRF